MYIFPLEMLENVWDYPGLSGNVRKCQEMSGNVGKYWKDKRPPREGMALFLHLYKCGIVANWFSYHAKLKRISRGIPAPFTFAMSASKASEMFACSDEYFFANS